MNSFTGFTGQKTTPAVQQLLTAASAAGTGTTLAGVTLMQHFSLSDDSINRFYSQASQADVLFFLNARKGPVMVMVLHWKC